MSFNSAFDCKLTVKFTRNVFASGIHNLFSENPTKFKYRKCQVHTQNSGNIYQEFEEKIVIL